MPGIGIGISPALKRNLSTPLNPLNTGLKSRYYFNNNLLATKGLQDGAGVDITYSADNQGYKVNLNGSTSRVYIDASSDFTFSGDFTMEVDFTLNTTGVGQSLLSQCNTLGSDASISFLWYVDSSNKVNFTFYQGGSFYTLTSSSSVTTSVKYVALIERSGNVYNLYLNNSSEATLTHAGAIQVSYYKIGVGALGEYIGAGWWFNGSVSIVGTWDRTLTAPEKTEVYNGGLGNKFIVSPSTWGTSDVTTQIIDANSVGYSTFQSNSQRNAKNVNGEFAVFLHSTTGGSFLNQTWYLKRSIDNGRTWQTVYTNTCYDQVPTLETDTQANLYLMYVPVSGAGAQVRWLKFSHTDYTTPSITTNLTISYSSKMCTCIDETNNKFYFFMGLGYYAVLNLSGTILINVTQMWSSTVGLVTEYPSATIDNNGYIYSAWTTQNLPSTPIYYYDIRWIVSRDFGATWQMADGTPLTLPIASGGGEAVTDSGDLVNQNWLSGWTFVNGRLHALYCNYTNGVTYVTINPTSAAKTNKTAIINTGTFSLDGFFSRDKTGTLGSPTPLYLITSDNRTTIECYKSIDNGVTWTAWASRSLPQVKYTYSICGYREQVSSKIIGIYTLLTARASTYTENDGAYTYFTKINI